MRRPCPQRTWRTKKSGPKIRHRTHQLVRHVTVILASELLPDGGLHQSRQGGEHVDRRVDLSVVKLTVDKDLALYKISNIENL
jgi:hypothetical protein